MPDCDRFELFTITALAGGLSRAALQLGICKSALSKQLKQLEMALNVDLFSRAGYRLSLTPQGKRLLEQTLRLKRELDDTRTICQQFHQAPTGP